MKKVLENCEDGTAKFEGRTMKCNGCGKLTDNECSICNKPLCDSVGEGCVCSCQEYI